MTLVLEDGTALSTAQSYVSASTVSEYCTARGLTSFPALSTGAREPTVLRAMRWFEGFYREKWRGRKYTRDQALSWPRAFVVDSDGFGIDAETIPQCVKDAVCEAAEREAASAGSLGSDLSRGGAVNSEQVGPIAVEYAAGANPETMYPTIDRLLSRVLQVGGRVLRG